MTDNPFDKAGRFLIRWDPTAFIAWVLGIVPDDLKFVTWLETQNTPFLNAADRRCDTVASVLDQKAGDVPWAIIGEFQIKPDADILGRVMIYGGAVYIHQKPYPRSGRSIRYRCDRDQPDGQGESLAEHEVHRHDHADGDDFSRSERQPVRRSGDDDGDRGRSCATCCVTLDSAYAKWRECGCDSTVAGDGRHGEGGRSTQLIGVDGPNLC